MEANDLLVIVVLVEVEILDEDGWSWSSCCHRFAAVGDDGLKDGAMRQAFVGVSGTCGSLLTSSEEEEEE